MFIRGKKDGVCGEARYGSWEAVIGDLVTSSLFSDRIGVIFFPMIRQFTDRVRLETILLENSLLSKSKEW